MTRPFTGRTGRFDRYTRRLNSFCLQSEIRHTEHISQALLRLSDRGIAKIGRCRITNVDHQPRGAGDYVEVLHRGVRGRPALLDCGANLAQQFLLGFLYGLFPGDYHGGLPAETIHQFNQFASACDCIDRQLNIQPGAARQILTDFVHF